MSPIRAAVPPLNFPLKTNLLALRDCIVCCYKNAVILQVNRSVYLKAQSDRTLYKAQLVGTLHTAVLDNIVPTANLTPNFLSYYIECDLQDE